MSSVLVPLTLVYLSVFCQPHNDVLHSLYIVVFVLHLVLRMRVVALSRILGSFHILVVFLTKKLFFGENLLALKCKSGSITTIINSCILPEEMYRLDMLLLLSWCCPRA